MESYQKEKLRLWHTSFYLKSFAAFSLKKRIPYFTFKNQS